MKGALIFLAIFVVLIAFVFVGIPLVRSLFQISGSGGLLGNGPANRNAGGGVLVSKDSGASWASSASLKDTSLTLNADILFLDFDPQDSSLLYAGTLDNGLYKSETGGETWFAVTDGDVLTGNSTVYKILFGKEPGMPLYAAVFQKGLGMVLKSADKGKTFSVMYVAPVGNVSVNDIAQDPSDYRLYVGTAQGGLLESADGGETWKVLRWFPGAIVRIKVHPQTGSVWIFTRESRVFRSDTKGDSWVELTDSFKDLAGSKAKDIRTLVFDPFNRGTVYLGTGLGLLKSTDIGGHWNLMRTIVPPEFLPIQAIAISPQNPNNILISASTQIYRTKDGGNTWAVTQLQVNKPVGLLLFSPTDSKKIFAALKK